MKRLRSLRYRLYSENPESRQHDGIIHIRKFNLLVSDINPVRESENVLVA